MRCDAAWVLTALCTWGVPASAQPASAPKAAALSWVRLPGAERCPDVRALAVQVEARLHRAAFVPPPAAQLLIEASTEPAPESAWKVRIALSDESGVALGTRELLIDQPNCVDAIDAAALAIALMIDPDAALRAERLAPAPARESPSAQPSHTPPPTEPTPERVPEPVRDSSAAPEPSFWRSRLSLAGTLALGALPGLAPGVLGALRLSEPKRRWGFDFAGAYLPSRVADVRASSGTGSFSATSGELLGWFALGQRGPISLSVAGGLEAASVSAAGTDFTGDNRTAQIWQVNGQLELELDWSFAPRWSALLRPGLGVPLRHDRFQATVGGRPSTVFEPSPVAGTLTLGVGFEP